MTYADIVSWKWIESQPFSLGLNIKRSLTNIFNVGPKVKLFNTSG